MNTPQMKFDVVFHSGSDDDEEKELGRDEKDGNELNYSNDSNDNLEQRKVSSILAEKDKLYSSPPPPQRFFSDLSSHHLFHFLGFLIFQGLRRGEEFAA
ncbi:hypothetical protein P8452_53418 [Trifolium repens]|nr:hypothetical protein P8452_53418 [Trifolium repens]